MSGNNFATMFLIFMLVSLFMIIGQALADEQGALIGLGVAALMSLYSYWFSDKMVIRAYHGQEVTKETNARLYNIVHTLAQRAGLPTPKIYIIPEEQPNAFATGRNPQHAAVACTVGLLKIMDDHELSGVLGHELGHIQHRDILISTIAAIFAGAISNISRLGNVVQTRNRQQGDRRGGVMLMFAPVVALILQMSISRKREFLADKAGAEFSGNPLYLRDSLAKLEMYSQRIALQNIKNPETAHMFIVNPFAGLSGFKNLFRTHPATADRIRELEKMAREQGLL